MSDATIYNWLKQDKIDRGEIECLSTDQAVEKHPDHGTGDQTPSAWPPPAAIAPTVWSYISDRGVQFTSWAFSRKVRHAARPD